MTKLSVNINKVATLRNARGGNMPDVQRFAVDCELFGAQGITVHPRPDERHIRKEDVYQLKSMVTTELNVEGNPTDEFLALVTDIRPTQVTLVPDDPSQLTSNHGWDTRRHLDFLKGVVNQLHAYRIRVSIFVDPDPLMVEYALRTGADRVELYTGPYAEMFKEDPKKAIEKYRPAAEKAHELGLGMNAACTLVYNLPAGHKYVRLKGLVGYDSSCDTDAPSGGNNCTMKFLIYATSSKTYVSADLTALGYTADEEVSVKDCWSGETLESVKGTLSAEVGNHGARLLKISAPKSYTGIHAVDAVTTDAIDATGAASGQGLYDMMGRKLGQEPKHGLYIKNGQKFFK